MDRRLAVPGHVGMMLAAWLLLAHFATGLYILHGLAGHHGEIAGQASHVAPPIPPEPAAVACSDGGACSLADRPPIPLDGDPRLVVVVVLAVLSATVATAAARRLRRAAAGPAPPPHLSAQVVLVI